MVQIRSLKESAYRYARNSVRAFLGKGNRTNEKWIVGVIRASGVSADDFRGILDSLNGYGDKDRYQFLSQLITT